MKNRKKLRKKLRKQILKHLGLTSIWKLIFLVLNGRLFYHLKLKSAEDRRQGVESVKIKYEKELKDKISMLDYSFKGVSKITEPLFVIPMEEEFNPYTTNRPSGKLEAIFNKKEAKVSTLQSSFIDIGIDEIKHRATVEFSKVLIENGFLNVEFDIRANKGIVYMNVWGLNE